MMVPRMVRIRDCRTGYTQPDRCLSGKSLFSRGLHMTPLDLLTLLSYMALNVDILLQIKRIYRTKSSHDLSLAGMSIRYAAILIILIKFISISDVPLIIGQGLIVLTFTTYFTLSLYYFANRHAPTSG
jgi:uncharacterized protein with PQ loop repeat